jgi:hypothetical protein
MRGWRAQASQENASVIMTRALVVDGLLRSVLMEDFSVRVED